MKCGNIWKQKLDVIRENVNESGIDQCFIDWIFYWKTIDKKMIGPSKTMLHERFKSIDHMNEIMEMA